MPVTSIYAVVVVQPPSCVESLQCHGQASLSFIISWSLLRFTSIESVMLTISFSATLFSFCFQSFPVSGAFPGGQLFTSGSQSIGGSALAQILPMNIQGWFPLGLMGLILLSQGLSRVFSSTTVWKHQFFSAPPSLWSSSHIHTWLLEKP